MSLVWDPPPTPEPPPGWRDYLATLFWLGVVFATWIILLKAAMRFMAQNLT